MMVENFDGELRDYQMQAKTSQCQLIIPEHIYLQNNHKLSGKLMGSLAHNNFSRYNNYVIYLSHSRAYLFFMQNV